MEKNRETLTHCSKKRMDPALWLVLVQMALKLPGITKYFEYSLCFSGQERPFCLITLLKTLKCAYDKEDFKKIYSKYVSYYACNEERPGYVEPGIILQSCVSYSTYNAYLRFYVDYLEEIDQKVSLKRVRVAVAKEAVRKVLLEFSTGFYTYYELACDIRKTLRKVFRCHPKWYALALDIDEIHEYPYLVYMLSNWTRRNDKEFQFDVNVHYPEHWHTKNRFWNPGLNQDFWRQQHIKQQQLVISCLKKIMPQGLIGIVVDYVGPFFGIIETVEILYFTWNSY